ncbi:CidA/LrgA family protein [Bdellovibrio bacteriovorus]|uniref:CidA/LrgA family protein n=1 Tax=Bdellovibrio TaxID=958 RepID=UPI0035A968CC
MILALLILLCFQLLGEGTVVLFNLFIPGPVLGMVYFFIGLMLYPPLKQKVEALSHFMNAHLALFFVPAGVGIIEYFDLFGKYGWAMGVTLLVSTTVTLGVTAWFFNILLKTNKTEQSHD